MGDLSVWQLLILIVVVGVIVASIFQDLRITRSKANARNAVHRNQNEVEETGTGLQDRARRLLWDEPNVATRENRFKKEYVMAEKKRWGLVTFCIVMVVLHLYGHVVAEFKTPHSVYGAFWIMASYWVIKGKLHVLSTWLKVIIVANAALLIFVFAGWSSADYMLITGMAKAEVITGAAMALLVNMFVYKYVINEIQKEKNALSKDNSAPVDRHPSDTVDAKVHSTTGFAPAVINDDAETAVKVNSADDDASSSNEIYETISEELDNGTFNKALWTRLYAENDGDDIRTKVAYIKNRADYFIRQARDKAAQERQCLLEKYELEENQRRYALIDEFFSLVREDDLVRLLKMLGKHNFLEYETDEDGNTPLHVALLERSFHVANFFILRGADRTKKNHQGLSPFDIGESILRSEGSRRITGSDAGLTLRALGIVGALGFKQTSIINFSMLMIVIFWVVVAVAAMIFS